MMIRQRRLLFLVLLVPWVGGSFGGESPQAGVPQGPPESEFAAQTFERMLTACPEESLRLRREIMAAGETSVAYLSSVEDSGESWLVRAFAGAIRQRIECPEKVRIQEDEFLSLLRGISGQQDPSAHRAALSTPFLAEKLLKGDPDLMGCAPAREGDQGDVLRDVVPPMPRISPVAILEALGGKEVARIAAVSVLTDHAPEKTLEAGELTDGELVDAMIAVLSDKRKLPVAAWVLGELGDSRAVDPLAATLTDYAVGLYLSPANALAKIGEPALPALASMLRSSMRPTQSWARHALGKMGEIAIPTLEEAIETGSDIPNCHLCTAGALRWIGGSKVVPALVEALESPDPQARMEAGYALGEIGDDRAREPLLQALDRPENHDQIALFGIAEALGKLKETRALEPLLMLAQHEDSLVRRAAIQGLGLMGDCRAVPVLIQCLTHESLRTRGDAAFALGQIGDRAAVPDLIVALEDGEHFVRSWSAWALGVIGDPQALPALHKVAQEDPDEDVRKAALAAIEKIRSATEG